MADPRDAEIARLVAELETWKESAQHQGVMIENERDRAEKAEAGEDALAEALKYAKETFGFNRQILTTLAAYEARRKGK